MLLLRERAPPRCGQVVWFAEPHKYAEITKQRYVRRSEHTDRSHARFVQRVRWSHSASLHTLLSDRGWSSLQVFDGRWPPAETCQCCPHGWQGIYATVIHDGSLWRLHLTQTLFSKKKAAHKAVSADDTKLQNCLKRMQVNTIPGIQEVNIFQGENVIQFANPKCTNCSSMIALRSDEYAQCKLPLQLILMWWRARLLLEVSGSYFSQEFILNPSLSSPRYTPRCL